MKGLTISLNLIDFQASILKFKLRTVKDNVIIPEFIGHKIRGLVLKLIQKTDPELSANLHKNNDIRPYAVSNAFYEPNADKKPKYRNGLLTLTRKTPMYFVFKTINQKISGTLVNALIEANNDPFTFDVGQKEVDFYLENIEMKVENYNDKQFKEMPKSEIFYVDFLKPTQFQPLKLPGIYLFPEPRYLFGNLIRTANDLNLTKENVDANIFLEEVANSIYVRKYQLRTFEYRFTKYESTFVGFKGWVEYNASKFDDKLFILLPFLTKIGEVLNVGKFRTIGLGRIKSRFLPVRQQNN